MEQAKCSPVRHVRAPHGAIATSAALATGSHNPALFVRKGHGTNTDDALRDRRLVMGAPAVRVQFSIEPLMLQPEDAARALGISGPSFDRYVNADVRCVRRGSLRLYPVSELRRWADENAEKLL
jgi:hypothetical protein